MVRWWRFGIGTNPAAWWSQPLTPSVTFGDSSLPEGASCTAMQLGCYACGELLPSAPYGAATSLREGGSCTGMQLNGAVCGGLPHPLRGSSLREGASLDARRLDP